METFQHLLTSNVNTMMELIKIIRLIQVTKYDATG